MPPDEEAPDAADGGGDPVEHLWNAAHEMLRAMRTLIDAADEFVDAQRGERKTVRNQPDPRDGRVHHIDIDIRADADTDSGASGAARPYGAS
jgi:hypothetical protein